MKYWVAFYYYKDVSESHFIYIKVFFFFFWTHVSAHPRSGSLLLIAFLLAKFWYVAELYLER